ncbi:MAG: ABC transporter permease [Williamsia sp.]|nr:ABC transporter permease [Williamsia sp.]
MLYNLKYALRNLLRNKIYAAINIGGLAVSLAAFIFMALYIEDEKGFDRFHAQTDRIYRIEDEKRTGSVLLRTASSAAPVGPALQQDFPAIKAYTRLMRTEALVKYGDNLFEERNIFYSDARFFKLFSFPLLSGAPDKALEQPNSVVLTQHAAQKYFGREDPLGKLITLDGKNMQVTGVMENVPANSHLQFDLLVSMATAQQKGSGSDWLFDNWYSNQMYTYVLLAEKDDIQKLSGQLRHFERRHREANSNTTHHYKPVKLSDIYLYSNRDNQAGKTGSLSNLYIFTAVALFILLLAAINFINLSTARASVRAKEVAVKKVAGAGRGQIITQFLAESFLLTAGALAAAMVIVYLLLPVFNQFSGKELSIDLTSPVHAMALMVLLVVIVMASGFYPALILSGFQPATSLKGKIPVSPHNLFIRKGLVVLQFAVAIILIIGSAVVYKQMGFWQAHELGFRPAQTMVIDFEGDVRVKQNLPYLKERLLQLPGVRSVAASSSVPGDGSAGGWSMDVAKRGGDTIHTELPVYLTDYTFLQQYHVPVIAGRPLSMQYAADSTTSMLINETALRKLGFHAADEAIGVRVEMYPAMGIITGVFKDFHFESLQKEIEPLAIRMLPAHFRLLSVEIDGQDLRQTVAAVEKLWQQEVPERPLEWSFLQESFNNQYKAQLRFGQVFALFTLLAIFIACLGLFGLALFSVQQRVREIGIRKVLGAPVASITLLISRDFLQLVFIAILVASPLAAYLMHRWLQDFAYRIQLDAWIFVLAGLLAMLVALATVGFQAIRAAIRNPVKSLRVD